MEDLPRRKDHRMMFLVKWTSGSVLERRLLVTNKLAVDGTLQGLTRALARDKYASRRCLEI